jgi:hypothetical protein
MPESDDDRMAASTNAGRTARAILTDAHFWIPVVVLFAGVALLVALR